MKYQKKSGMSLFEQENTLESLSKMENPLVMLKEIIDFEQFRDELEKLFTKNRKKTTESSRRHAAASSMSMVSWNRA